MYDLEDRTYQFAKDVALFIKKPPKQLLILSIPSKSSVHQVQLVPTI
jgi:hypothetical protein